MGGGGGGSTCGPGVTMNVTFFNDSARLPGNVDYRFSAGDTVYYTISVYNATAGQGMAGDILLIREYHEDYFPINGSYNGSFTVNNDDHSGWWYTATVFDGAVCGMQSFDSHFYMIEPILTSIQVSPFREFTCDEKMENAFAPSDTLYIKITPIDQAGWNIDQNLFNYNFFNITNIQVYNKTYNSSGEFVDTIIENVTYSNLAEYQINCTDPNNQTYTHTDRNIADTIVLPDRYERWYLDVYTDSSYASLNKTDGGIFMPIYASNVSLSLAGLLNPGRNMTVSFDGWLNARNEVVVPDHTAFFVDEANATYGDGWGSWLYVGYYDIGYDLTNPFSFIIQKNPLANLGTMYFSSFVTNYNIGMPGAEFNVTNDLTLSLAAPASATEGDSLPISLNVSWANGDRYTDLGNITALVTNPSGQRNITLQESNGVYSTTTSADATGSWNVTVDLKDAYNNTGFASSTFTINQKSNPCTSCGGGGGGGGGGSFTPANVTNSTGAKESAAGGAQQLAAGTGVEPASQPASGSSPTTGQKTAPASPTGFFAVGAGITSAITSIVQAITGFFGWLMHLFG
jgi:hypothetical protein